MEWEINGVEWEIKPKFDFVLKVCTDVKWNLKSVRYIVKHFYRTSLSRQHHCFVLSFNDHVTQSDTHSKEKQMFLKLR